MYEITKFSERLKELMEEKDITPELLSNAVEYSGVYHWLSSKYLPSYNNLIKLADYFLCTIDYLVGLKEENSFSGVIECPPFSVQFKHVLKECSNNLYRLSKLTKIDRRTMYDWIEGQYVPTLENLVRISTALDCSIDYIVGRES